MVNTTLYFGVFLQSALGSEDLLTMFWHFREKFLHRWNVPSFPTSAWHDISAVIAHTLPGYAQGSTISMKKKVSSSLSAKTGEMYHKRLFIADIAVKSRLVPIILAIVQ